MPTYEADVETAHSRKPVDTKIEISKPKNSKKNFEIRL